MALAVWIAGRLLDNFSLAHPAFPFACAGLAVFYAWFGSGWYLRRFTIAALATLWGARLGSRLFLRLTGRIGEDGRWQSLRSRWGPQFPRRLLIAFLAAAVAIVALSLAFLLPAQNPRVNYHPFELAGVALWFIALIGETLADAQLAHFKRDPARRDQVCAVGLWRFSRHPNYFFEWLLWVAFFVFALGSPFGWAAAIAPALMLYVLLRVTGIPPNEAQSLRSKGEAYELYQNTTSRFVPRPPRRPPTSN